VIRRFVEHLVALVDTKDSEEDRGDALEDMAFEFMVEE